MAKTLSSHNIPALKVNFLGKDSVKRLIFFADYREKPLKGGPLELAFVSPAHDRLDHLRRKPAELANLLAGDTALIVRVRGDLIEVEGELPAVFRTSQTPEQIFLGCLADGTAWFAERAREDAPLLPLRGLMLSGLVTPELLSLLAQARSLVHWHEAHGFCAKCGVASRMGDGGYRRHCAACGADHFPRTDPVVIIAVTWNGRVLMGRQVSWPDGMYSTLAGFMEPGETIEDAARREVWEESGIRVGAVSYVQCQPWPFPSSLMIGLVGEALTHDVRIDTNELQDARWFSFAEARQMLRRTHPEGLTASSPYAIAHHLVCKVVGA